MVFADGETREGQSFMAMTAAGLLYSVLCPATGLSTLYKKGKICSKSYLNLEHVVPQLKSSAKLELRTKGPSKQSDQQSD